MTRILSASEGSRCMPLVILMPVNTSRREGFRLSAEHRHSERSEESRCLMLVGIMSLRKR